MAEDRLLANFVHRDWLMDSALDVISALYVDSLRIQRYADSTIHDLLSALAHFAHWMKIKEFVISNIDEAFVDRFLHVHLPHCQCPEPCCRDIRRSCSALTHLLRLLRQEGLFRARRTRPTFVSVEVERFAQHLRDTCGLALSTSRQRAKYASEFLESRFGNGPVKFSTLKPSDVDKYFAVNAGRWSARSLSVIRDCLASYFRFRAFLGDHPQSLRAALPVLHSAHRGRDFPTFSGGRSAAEGVVGDAQQGKYLTL